MSLFKIIEKEKAFFLKQIQNDYKQFLFDSIYIGTPAQLFSCLTGEFKSFLAFLQTGNIHIPCSNGNCAVSKGLDENIIFPLFNSIQNFIFEYIDINPDNVKTVIKLSNEYMKHYLAAFHKEKNLRKDVRQEQLHRAVNMIIARQREEMLEKEKEQNRQRTAFLVNLAHETKIPLTIIRNQIHMIMEEAGRIQLQTLPPLEEQVRGLQEMIGNILDSEKILQGKMLYNHDAIINISNAVLSKINAFKGILGKRTISLESGIEPGLYVHCDPEALDRILNNILDNAVKYNREKGSITVTLKSDAASVLFIARDTGIGIPSHELGNIFKPYYQCTKIKRSNQGIGAGLSIVKSILGEITGSIDVKSIENAGTTVTISFKKEIITKENENKVVENIKVSRPVSRMNMTLKQELYDEKRKRS